MRKEDVTYSDKLSELKLDIDHPNNTNYLFILVEGDSDIRLYRKFFDSDHCKVDYVPGGNPKLEECVDELLKTSSNVIGIRDADFIHANGEAYSKKNMFLTDYHDLEISLIKEDEICFSVLCEYTDIAVKECFDVKEKILNSIEKISYLKWLNSIENLELKFEAGFQDLLANSSFEVSLEQYFSRVLSDSPNALIRDINVIKAKIDALMNTSPDRYQLCNGHDFMKALSQFIRNQGKVKGVSDDRISGVFRVAFRQEFLSRTELYRKTDDWARNNGHVMYYIQTT